MYGYQWDKLLEKQKSKKERYSRRLGLTFSPISGLPEMLAAPSCLKIS
jgi:hypothetical protein